MNRRYSLKLMVAAMAYAKLVGCGMGKRPFPVTMCGADAKRGHRFRDGAFPAPVRVEDHNVAIVGGGIAGLSAARALAMAGLDDLLVFELEDHVGGNSRYGENAVGRYPLAAHYLTLPDPADVELVTFLQDIGVCTGKDAKGLPVYREEYLCGDPQERLFHQGVWRAGLRPRFGLSVEEEQEVRRFEAYVDKCRDLQGPDGRWAFAIPVDRSSLAMPEAKELDAISFQDLLKREGYTSEALHWYLDYCCRDDFGASLHQVSAWAGIHYFASRRGVAANADPGSVLTWPEGNGFLVDALRTTVADRIRRGCIVHAVRAVEDRVEVDVFDTSRSETVRYRCARAILSVPQFVAARMLGDEGRTRAGGMQYAPWAVVNITLDHPPEERGGEPMAWDNVRFGSGTLGYVNACHQRLDRANGLVLTHYRALVGVSPEEARMRAHSVEAQQWADEALDELALLHPDIRERVRSADVAIWGHGMVVPVPGFITGAHRPSLATPIAGRIHFAHSDLSGMSMFEEAFHHGIRAAAEVLQPSPPAA